MKNFSAIFIILLVTSTHFHDFGVNALHLTSTTHSNLLSTKKSGFEIDSAGLAKECIDSLMEVIPPDFCWKSGGDVGIIPKGCPPGYFRSLALCFEYCPSNYRHILGICYKNCESGYDDHGLTCYKNLIRWYFKRSYIPSSLTNFSPRVPCPEGMYRQGALCYKDCGVINMANCGIGACSSDSDSCASSILNMVVETMKGALDAVLLIVSFGTSSAAGMTAKASLKSAASKLGPNALKAAAKKLKSKLTGAFAGGIKQSAMRLAKQSGKKFVKFVGENVAQQTLETAVATICEPIFQDFADRTTTSTVNIDVNTVVNAVDIFNIQGIATGCSDTSGDGGLSCAKNVVQGLQTFDPTGVLTIAAAFMHPECPNMTPSRNEATLEQAMVFLGSVPDGCIQVFTDCNYQGKGVTICQNTKDLKTLGFSDNISAIKTGKGAYGLFFQNIEFGGIALPFTEEQLIPCLLDYNREELKMNDLISSVGFGYDLAIVFSFKFKYFDIVSNYFFTVDTKDMAIELPLTIEYFNISMYHPNLQLELYPETDFRGTPLRFDTSTDSPVTNFPFNFIRSYKVIHDTVLQSGYYNIRAKHSSLYIDVKDGSTADNATLIQYSKTGNDNQKFYFALVPRDPKDTFTIQVTQGGKYLEANQDDNVVQDSPTLDSVQKWKLASNNDGSFTITSINTGKVMGIEGKSRSSGASLKQMDSTSGDADHQRFFLEKV